MRKALLASLVLAVAAGRASATVTIGPQIVGVYADNGTTPLPKGSLVAWVAEMTPDAFDAYGTTDLGPDGFVVPDVQLLGTGSSGNVNAGFVENTFVLDVFDPADAQGQPLGMLWFGVPASSAPADGAGGGVGYGFWDAADEGYSVPLDGAWESSWPAERIGLAGGSLSDDTFHADKTTVPEPATVLLILAGGGWLAARRRRRA